MNPAHLSVWRQLSLCKRKGSADRYDTDDPHILRLIHVYFFSYCIIPYSPCIFIDSLASY